MRSCVKKSKFNFVYMKLLNILLFYPKYSQNKTENIFYMKSGYNPL